jgi:enamine deaminase RidA (YjgF/YER057c/UK114 family)
MSQKPRKTTFEVLGDAEEMYGIPGLPFVPAVKVPAGHDLIFISGVLGPATAEDPATDIRSEARRAFRHMADVLALAGATFDDVVSVDKFIVDMERHNPVIVEVMHEFFTRMPSSTTVEVTRLVPADLRFEIKAVAAVRAEPR